MKPKRVLLYLLMAVTAMFSFFFCLIAVDVSLHHHFQQIAWQSGQTYLKYHLFFAGGLAEYLSLFVAQFFYSNWLGSFIVSLFGLLISLFVFKTISVRWEKLHFSYFFIPLIQIIVLALMCDYRFHFSVIFNLFMVSAFLLICIILQNKYGFAISYHNIITGILLYYISGGIYFLIFMFSSILLLSLKSLKYWITNTLVFLVLAFLLPYLAHRFIFLSSLQSSFFRSTPEVAAILRYSRSVLFFIALAIIPFIFLVAHLSSVNLNLNRSKKTSKRKSSVKPVIQKTSNKEFNFRFYVIGIQFILLLTVSGFILFKNYKPAEKLKIDIDFQANRQNWNKVLELCSKTKTYDRMVNFQFNRALLNTGKLLENLFDYEQLLGSQGLFLDRPFAAEVALPNSDIYFDLGNIDESQRYAFESETLMPYSPRVLKRLILNSLIFDNRKAANTFLNVLASNPMEKKWSDNYRSYVENGEKAGFDSLIVMKRSDMNKTEGMIGTPPLKLINQLEKNPKNKAAFECLIAFDLLEHDLASFSEDLKYMSKLGYTKLPKLMEEAVVLFRSQTRNNEFLNRIRISKQTTERFNEFAKLTSAAKGDRNRAKKATVEFKNTYWYYVLFLSPKVTGLRIETRPVEAIY